MSLSSALSSFLAYFRPSTGSPPLLLATFNDLYWWEPASGNIRMLHTGAGKYYGLAAGQSPPRPLERVYVVSRPDPAVPDSMLEIETGAIPRVLRAIPLRSHDTHHAIRAGEQMIVTDTGHGGVHVYDLPDFGLAQEYGGFDKTHHVNSLLRAGNLLYVLCHNKGKSEMAVMDVHTRRKVDSYPDVGTMAHDIAIWRDSFIVCDSKNGGLLRVDRATKRATQLFRHRRFFTKGLVVEGDVAYLGISRQHHRVGRYHLRCDVLAYDLARDRVLWRRRLRHRGLVNAIATAASLTRQATSSAGEVLRHAAGPGA